MRIERLEISNFKSLEDLRLSGIGDRTLIVGPNGCGKSSVLDAVAALKEFVGSYQGTDYQRRLPNGSHSVAWPEHIANPVKAGATQATITAEFSLSGEEQTRFALASRLTAKVEIAAEGGVRLSNDANALKPLFRHYDPTLDIGVIDYLGASRTFSGSRIQTIDPRAINRDRERAERVEFPGSTSNQKFAATKQYLISQQFSDFTETQDSGADPNSLSLLKEIFARFFAPKSLKGAKRIGDEYQFLVDTPFGAHDIDLLSSGEKELFSVLVSLFRIRHLACIVLYDEPERHLNAGLEAKIIPALDALQSRNQLIIATHGVELIASVPLSDIVYLRRDDGKIRAERLSREIDSDRVRLLESLGVSVGLQLSVSRVVFVEGKDTNSDKRLIEKMIGSDLPGTVFVASGGSTAALAAAIRVHAMFSQSGGQARVFSVIDRDYRTDTEREILMRQAAHRVHVWTVHEVENLLINSECILEILVNSGIETLPDAKSVHTALHKIAVSLKEKFVYELLAQRLSRAGNPSDDRAPKPVDSSSFDAWCAAKKRRASMLFDDEQIKGQHDTVRQEIEEHLSNDEWITRLPGKEILEGFRAMYIPKVGQEIFKEQIASVIVARKKHHADIQALREFIMRD